MSTVHIPKTRHGGTFTDPNDVNLHANDFSWQEKMQELSTEEKGLVDDYVRLFNSALSSPEESFDCQQAEKVQKQSEPWEAHYISSRHHFPLKNYIVHAFPSLKKYLNGSHEGCAILECGCGNGSTLLPLMKQSQTKNITFVGFDVSATSVRYFSEHEVAADFKAKDQLYLFQYDASSAFPEANVDVGEQAKKRPRTEGHSSALASHIAKAFPALTEVKYDAVLLVFVLSAFTTVDKMRTALRQLRGVMKPDAVLLFRDYALPDHNFFRFIAKNDGRVSNIYFPKGDSTSQTFFEREYVLKLFEQCGFTESTENDSEKLQYHCNRIVNRKNGKRMDKIFINGAFRLKH